MMKLAFLIFINNSSVALSFETTSIECGYVYYTFSEIVDKVREDSFPTELSDYEAQNEAQSYINLYCRDEDEQDTNYYEC